MLVQSTLGGPAGSGDVLVLSNGTKRILVQVPQTYADLVSLSNELLGTEGKDPVVFKTDDLTVCRGAAVEIHSSCWDSVRSVVGTVTVSTPGMAVKQPTLVRQSLGGSARIAGSSKTEQRISFGRPAPASSSATLQSRQPSLPSSSLEDDLDSIPLEEEFYVEEEEDEEDEYHPQVSPTKGKTRARNRIMSDDEEEEEVQAQVLRAPLSSGSGSKPSSRVAPKPLASRITPFSSPAPRASPATSGKVKGTPKDLRDIFSPSVKRLPPKARIPFADEDEEDEDEENEQDENVAPPSSARSTFSTKSNSSRAHKVAEEAVLRSVKKTPQKSTNYSPLGDVSPSPKPKLKSQTPAFKKAHTPARSSSLRRSLTQAEMQAMAIEPFMPLLPLAPPPPADGKILITISHPPSGQENKFKIKEKHIAGRVLTKACEAFGLDVQLAHLILQVEEDGVEMTCECKKDQPLDASGVRHGSELFIRIDDDAEAEAEESDEE